MEMQEIEKKLKALNYNEETKQKIRNSGAFSFLPKYLLGNENIYYIGLSSLPSEAATAMIFSDVLLVITDKRLFLLVKRIIGVECKEFLYSRINLIENSGLGNRANIITLKTSSGDISFGVGSNINEVVNLIYDGINGLLVNKDKNISTNNYKYNNYYEDKNQYFSNSEYEYDLVVNQVFNIKQGTVITGIALSKISIGDTVIIYDNNDNIIKKDIVLGIEHNRELLDETEIGYDVGLFFRGLKYTEIKEGYKVVVEDEIYEEIDEFYEEEDKGIINIEAAIEVATGILVVGTFLDNVLIEDKIAVYDDNDELVAISRVIGLEKDKKLVNRVRNGDYAGMLLEKISYNIKKSYRLEVIE